MNVKFLNPFVEAAYEVLLAETGIQMARGELTLDKAAYATDEVTVIISLVGRVEGNVFYALTEQMAVVLASRILGEQLQGFTTLAQSGVAELGNVITGRASVKLAEAGFDSTISPPALLLGKGAIISTLDMARLVVPLDCDFGSVRIHLALREGANRGTTAQLATPARPRLSEP